MGVDDEAVAQHIAGVVEDRREFLARRDAQRPVGYLQVKAERQGQAAQQHRVQDRDIGEQPNVTPLMLRRRRPDRPLGNLLTGTQLDRHRRASVL